MTLTGPPGSSSGRLPAPGDPRRVVVSGVSGTIGRAIVRAFEDRVPLGRLPGPGTVGPLLVGLDRVPPNQRPPWLDFRLVELADDAGADPDAVLDEALAGADVLVHLAWEGDPSLPARQLERVNVGGTRRLLDAAGRQRVGHVVVVSSATVYGAWPNNPVPLDEAAPMRPNPGYAPAVHKAEAERLVGIFRREHPDVAVCVLRPVFVLGPGAGPVLAALAHRGVPPAASGALPPRQFLHEDDAASAILTAVDRRLVGTYNVAPDRWEEPLVAEHAGHRARPRRLVRPVHPAILPYGQHPWVVSNARLRAAGWEPRHTTVEAVAACPPWREPRRPEVAVVALVAGLAAGAVLGRRRRTRTGR